MSKPQLKVIKGGLASSIKDMRKHFVSGYVTNTRLMGVLAVYARWRISNPEFEDKTLHQFFYIDCEEAGLETYKGIRGNNAFDIEAAEQALIGGLGAKKMDLTERQLRALMCKYKAFNEKHGLPLPAGKSEYDFMFEPEVVMDKEENDEVYQVVDQMPEFPGGMEALEAFIKDNIHYPDSAKNNNMQGRVLVSFVVNKDGSIADPVVIRSADHIFDNEAITVIRSMPNWIPGKMNGETVRVQFTVPVTFRL